MKDSRFLRACRKESVDRAPIWIMRQAGRYLPEYRAIRGARSMMEAVTTPEIAAQITLLPLKRFSFDAAILFSDLTVPFTAMGAPFELHDGIGPVVPSPIRTGADFKQLRLIRPDEDLPYVLETIRILKPELKVPLIGFTGAPFTLASYLIEGGPSKDRVRTRGLMYSEPVFWHALMELLVENVARYLTAQIEAGADAVQLFDSWIGDLNEAAYRRYLLPHMQRLFERLADFDVPVIHFGTGTSQLLGIMSEAGGSVIGVDWRITLEDASRKVPLKTLQGNLDPALLLAGGPAMRARALEILGEGRKLPGHIFNLGHGILPNTALEHVAELVDLVCGGVVAA